tara:strand:+ start:326 stop:916 length:591 start_codon:yes stop_codon:yes gene_type:complete
MRKILKSVLILFDDNIFRWIVKWVYPKYKRQRKGYCYNFNILRKYLMMQKVIGFNRDIPWPVDFRSKIIGGEKIKKGIMCDPGDNPGIYINASGGLKLGDNVSIGHNTSITTTNHDIYDHRKTSDKKGVVIGSNVWVGSNCSIVAGVQIGDNVTIGAGCTIRKNIPSNSLVIQEDSTISIIEKKAYQWNCTEEKLL